MAKESSKDFVVAIIGGGICGLALACKLVKDGITVNVFEAAAAFQEIGAGVGIGPNGIDALRGLGVLDAVVARSDEKGLQRRGFEFYTGDGPTHELIYTYPTDEKTLGLGIHRASMLDALASLLPPEVAHFNKRCVSVERPTDPGAPAIIAFSDGSTHAADIVIGCDGVKSVVRSAVSKSETKPVYMNTVAYRGLIPVSQLEGFQEGELSVPRMYGGLDKHIICFTVRGGTLLNVVAFCCDRSRPYGEIEQPIGLTWVTPATRDELLEQFQGWCSQATAIIKAIEKPTKWTLYALQPPLQNYVLDNIALVGDAAHAMLPHLGAGAGQGLEDGYLMARLLAHPLANRTSIPLIFQAYNRARQPRANLVLQSSTAAGEIWEGHGSLGPSIEARRANTEGIWDWVWHGYDLDVEFKEALQWVNDNMQYGN